MQSSSDSVEFHRACVGSAQSVVSQLETVGHLKRLMATFAVIVVDSRVYFVIDKYDLLSLLNRVFCFVNDQ